MKKNGLDFNKKWHSNSDLKTNIINTLKDRNYIDIKWNILTMWALSLLKTLLLEETFNARKIWSGYPKSRHIY